MFYNKEMEPSHVSWPRCACGCNLPLLPGGRANKTRLPGHAHDYVQPYIIDSSGCWVWQRNLSYDGYPLTLFEGKERAAHRMFYHLHKGAIPQGLELDHLCRIPACVNPNHLQVVTKSENQRRGIGSKLNTSQILEIRAALKSGILQKDLASKYGVSQSLISRINVGRR